MSGVVDPESIYTKQNCIGMLQCSLDIHTIHAYYVQVEGASEKCIKGRLTLWFYHKLKGVWANQI